MQSRIRLKARRVSENKLRSLMTGGFGFFLAGYILLFFALMNAAHASIRFQTSASEKGTFYLIIDGEISRGDAVAFLRQINAFKQDRIPVTQIRLNSPGGDVDEAAIMSHIISDNHLVTVVPDNWLCASACVLLFGAGIQRYAEPDSRVGVHRISIDYQDTDHSKSLSLDMDRMYTEMNFPENVKYKMLTTPPGDIYYLTKDDKINISTRYANTDQISDSYRNAGILTPKTVITVGDRNQARSLNRQAISDINSGQFEAAIRQLEMAKAIYPSDSEVLGNLGYAYYRMGNYKEAQNNLTSSLKLTPHRGSSWNNLGLVLASTNQIDWATNCFVNYWNYSKNKKLATNQFFLWEQQRPGSGIDIASKRARALLKIDAPDTDF